MVGEHSGATTQCAVKGRPGPRLDHGDQSGGYKPYQPAARNMVTRVRGDPLVAHATPQMSDVQCQMPSGKWQSDKPSVGGC